MVLSVRMWRSCVPGDVLHVVGAERGQAAELGVAVTPTGAAALLNAVCSDPCAQRLEAAAQGVQLRQDLQGGRGAGCGGAWG